MAETAIWEWSNDSSLWCQYDRSTAEAIEAAWVAGHASVSITLVPGAPSHLIEFKDATAWQSNLYTNRAREVRREQDENGEPCWSWHQDEDDTWHIYSNDVNWQIEQGWQQAEKSKTDDEDCGTAAVHFVLRSSPYLVTFATEGVQVRNFTGFRRGVRRRSGPQVNRLPLGSAGGQLPASQNSTGGTGAGPSETYNPKEVFLTDVIFHDDDICAICYSDLQEEDSPAVRLSGCPHQFHRKCIEEWFGKRACCPECLKHYGCIVGTQPIDGASMTVRYHDHDPNGWSLEGFPDAGVIEVRYNFEDGTQGPEHPHPGQPYWGTRRKAFLPWTPAGEEVLRRLKVAWERRLIFRVGQSITTGLDNCVVWAGIHHKTRRDGGAAYYGYPDETYLARVKGELADVGVQ